MTPRVYLVVVSGLVGTLVLCIGGIVALSLADPQRAIPDVLQNVTIGNLTGLVGLLVRPPPSTS